MKKVKSIAVSASVHTYNEQTKGKQHRKNGKASIKFRGPHLLGNYERFITWKGVCVMMFNTRSHEVAYTLIHE